LYLTFNMEHEALTMTATCSFQNIRQHPIIWHHIPCPIFNLAPELVCWTCAQTVIRFNNTSHSTSTALLEERIT
jgi:hypothetical protein